MTKSRNILPPRQFWTDEDLFVLRRRFPHERTDDVARALGRPYSAVAQKAASLGLVKTPEYLASPAAHRWDGRKGEGTRFQPGQTAWNKGVRGVVGVQEACRATQFKPGRPAHEARNYQPIGTLRLCRDGLLEQKVTDDPTVVPARRWVAVHRLVWERVNGPIPAGHAVVFKPGMRTAVEDEITADRLECITRRDLMLRNTVHRYGPEIAKVAQLRGAINRQINQRSKEQAE